MWECAWVTIYASLYKEWKWHLGEEQSGNPLTSVKSVLICWSTTANLLTSIPESSVTVKEMEVRVADRCDTESRFAFTLTSLLFPNTLFILPSLLFYSMSKKKKKIPLCQQCFFTYCRYLLYRQVSNVQKDMNTSASTALTPLLVMEENGNISTQCFIPAIFFQGWIAELVYMIVSICRRQRTLKATFSHIFIFFSSKFF